MSSFLTTSCLFSSLVSAGQKENNLFCAQLLVGADGAHEVHIPAVKVHIAGVDIDVPEIVYRPSGNNVSDEDILKKSLDRQDLRFHWSGKHRRVGAFEMSDGRKLVAKLYVRDKDPMNVARKIQRELLVEGFLKKMEIPIANISRVLPEGIVVQENGGQSAKMLLNYDYLHFIKQIGPALDALKSRFSDPRVVEFEKFLRTNFDDVQHGGIDRTVENIGVNFGPNSTVNLKMIDW